MARRHPVGTAGARAGGARPTPILAIALLLAGGLAVAGPALADPDAARSKPLPEGETAERLPEGEPSERLPDGDPAAQPLPDASPASRAAVPEARAKDAERVVWEAKREGVEDALRNVRLELDQARDRRERACPTPGTEGCAELHIEVQELEAQERALASYLETGMLAECLRTDCDRDWVRESRPASDREPAPRP